MTAQTDAAGQTILLNRSGGVTDAERYLSRLCKESFLSLWSYSGIFRDQGHVGKGGDGKEVCDMLVVFDNHLIIFSDKDCAFPDKGDLDLDWSRWYRKAIKKSADQIWGAERWIKEHPERLFLDHACAYPFPINLPSVDKMRVHRILVAHSASERCKRELSGSGSLMIMPHIIGDQHCRKIEDGGVPFAIGQIDSAKGYVHVFDDTTLDIVLTTLDTISDFVAYLDKKEHVITSGKLEFAAGEEDLLALYLPKLNEQNEHDFVIPTNIDAFSAGEGCWEAFKSNPQRKAQINANEVSYAWDGLIETFLHHIYAGTSHFNTPCSLAEKEPGFRLMAREPRTRRRMLAKSLLDFISKIPSNQRATRTMLPSRPGDPYYVFLVLPHLPSIPYVDYREGRRRHLEQCCMITKANFPDAEDIIGIATESGRTEVGSEAMLYFDAREWSPEQQAEVQQMKEEFQNAGVIGEYTTHKSRVKEYPDLPKHLQPQHSTYVSAVKGRDRNSPCSCGSGKKAKKCCGA